MSRRWVGAAIALLLTACQPADDTPASLTPIDAPNLAVMNADVAARIDERWQALEATRASAQSTDAAKADAYAAYGLALFGNGLSTQSRPAIANAAALAPQDARWAYFLALIDQYNGAFDAAAVGFERVLTLGEGDDVPTLLRLGQVRLEQARFDEAEATFERVLTLSPDSAAAHYGLGRIASARGQDGAAVEHFEATLANQPDADRAHYLLALAYRNLGLADQARASLAVHGQREPSFDDPLFDQVTGGSSRVDGLFTHLVAASQAYADGLYESAADEYESATRDLPDDARAWRGLGQARAKLGQLVGAERAFERALTLDGDSASLHHELAKVQMINGRRESAETHLRDALALDPGELAYYATYARLLKQTDRTEEALAQYDAALAIDPLSSDLTIDRAQALVSLQRLDEAVAFLSDAADARTTDTTVRAAYAMLLSEHGQTEAAIDELNAATQAALDDSARAKAQFALGRIEMGRSEVGNAIAAYEQALTLDPAFRQARLALARTQAGGRRYASALSTYEQYLAATPGDVQARMEAVTSALLQGSAADAMRLLEDGLRQASPSPRVQSAAARLLTLAGDPSLRDPERALTLARAAYEGRAELRYAETVALALAGSGRADDAINLQRQLVEQAAGRAPPNQQQRLQDNLARFEQGAAGRLPLDDG